MYVYTREIVIAYLDKAHQSGFAAMETSPRLFQFEYERSMQSADPRFIEGTILLSIQIILPCMHLSA
jgi:hypothetical protein